MTNSPIKQKGTVQDIPLSQTSAFKNTYVHTPRQPPHLHRLPLLHNNHKESAKRNRSHEAPAVAEKKKQKIKPPYLSGEDICRVSRGKAERVFAQTRNPKEELECLFNFCQINGKGTEIPQILRSRCEIGTGYSADLGHERGGKHISEIGAPGGLYARRPNARTEKNVQG